MSDLISRRAAVSRMSDLLMIELKGRRLPTWNEVYRAINELPSAQPETRWIPVTERLPEEDKYVLVSTEDNDIDIARYDYNEWCEDPEIEWWNGEYRVFPTAWMPLPEPYKEADNAQLD